MVFVFDDDSKKYVEVTLSGTRLVDEGIDYGRGARWVLPFAKRKFPKARLRKIMFFETSIAQDVRKRQ